jgi:hypothetical protein
MLNEDIRENNVATQKQQSEGQTTSAQRTPPSQLSKSPGRRRLILRIVSAVLLIMLIFAAVRLGMILSNTNDQLLVHIGNQQTALVDLRQSLPISPYLFGTNVFPAIGTNSVDRNFTGFMNYTPPISGSLQNAHINLLRFPGGNWGEEHILSYDQFNAFSALLSQVGADGMIQARLSGPIGDKTSNLATLTGRANLAGSWVDYMNNPRSSLRAGKYAGAPFHFIKFWTVGNEPDRQMNPDTGKPFTVEEYINDFIQFSIAMHQNSPTIMIFGPEISQFYGVGMGPTDPNGQLWMETFLKGVSSYEQAHPELKFHLLDGVSFHRYPLTDPNKIPTVLLSSTNEWNYLLPPLRQLIRKDLGRDAPVAVTEINSNPTGNEPSRGFAALWWADTLGTLMSQQVDYVAFFSTEGVDSPYPLFTSNGLQQTAMFRVMQVFSHLQRNLIPVDAQRDPINLYATQDDSHQAISLLFVNKSNVTQLAQVSTQNQFFGIGPWHNQDISLFGESITLVTLHRDGGAEAYTYMAPTTNDSAITPVTHSVCGTTSDILANNSPC